jgi:hypothetical protein
MTSVPHVGLSPSAELWRFSTSTRVWELADSGAGPSGRYGHVMTSVGLDLWVHGGVTSSGEGDMCNTRGAAAVTALRYRGCLFGPSVTVFGVVCMAHDLCDA